MKNIRPTPRLSSAGAQGADQDRLAPADAVGQRAVEHDAQAVGPEAEGGDQPHLRLVQVVPGADVVLDNVEVVAPHVHGGVGQPQREPVQEAPAAVFLGMLQRVARQEAHFFTSCQACQSRPQHLLEVGAQHVGLVGLFGHVLEDGVRDLALTGGQVFRVSGEFVPVRLLVEHLDLLVLQGVLQDGVGAVGVVAPAVLAQRLGPVDLDVQGGGMVQHLRREVGECLAEAAVLLAAGELDEQGLAARGRRGRCAAS